MNIRTDLFLSCSTLFPCVFSPSIYFVSVKMLLLFFCCCCLLTFWLCLFVRAGAFFAPRMLLCLCLWLTSTITWFSPFPPVFFLLFIVFFTTLKVVFCSCRFVVVFLAVLFRSCCRFIFVFCFVCFAA